MTSVTAPAVAAAGMNVSVTHVVKNLAAVAGGAPATFSRLFLSADATLDGGDVQLGADVPVGALAGGGMATVAKSVLIPPGTPPGRYFVIAQANATGTVVEADTPTLANNVRATATPITIGPDLVVTAATLAPTATAPGMTVNVTNTVKNQGGTGAGSFTVGIYLSADNVFDGGDTLLNSRPVLSLAAGMMSGPLVTPVVIPANQSAGSYFLIVRVDNAGAPGSVIEADETNNGLAVPLTVVQPDLTVQSVTATPPAIAPGANVSVTHVVKNVAVRPAPRRRRPSAPLPVEQRDAGGPRRRRAGRRRGGAAGRRRDGDADEERAGPRRHRAGPVLDHRAGERDEFRRSRSTRRARPTT